MLLKVVQPRSDEPESSTARDARRIFVSPTTIRSAKLSAGQWVMLGSPTSSSVAAQIWPDATLADDVVLLSRVHQGQLSALEVEVNALDGPATTPLARAVTVKLVRASTRSTSKDNARSIAAIKELLLSRLYIWLGMDVMDCGSPDLECHITDIEQSTKGAANVAGDDALTHSLKNLNMAHHPRLAKMDWRTKIVVEDNETSNSTVSVPSYINLYPPSSFSTSEPAYALLGGLNEQVKVIRGMLELPLRHPELYARFNLTPPRGVLLHGPPGTGKTALARAVASSNPACSCIVVNGPELNTAFHGETEERLRGVFAEAKRQSPCIIVLDEIDALCPRRDGDGGEVEKRVVATLLTLMDGMNGADDGQPIFVIAATNRPNSIDPALRRPGRFDREIEIGVPSAAGRTEILEIFLRRLPHCLSAVDVETIASRTHGFVGADLSSLVRESASLAIERWQEGTNSRSKEPVLAIEHLLACLPLITPSTMREVSVQTAQVKWEDIGGQTEVKQKLRECVEWPLTRRDTFTRLGVEAPKGVLLYGPPGCSKTMTAKALATESGINFLAVKGPELLNKYVGESEKAVREIFRKARTASPSIILFDEIDALGSTRTDDGSHSGVLTSLLNEMDGIEELSGVTVVAATNRPDVLDSALMRPGRLDRILYVGPPDHSTRKEIFRIRFAKMAVQADIDLDELARLSEGCSGAEVASICQDAALAAMQEDPDAPFVKTSLLLHSARTVRRRITPETISFFEAWRDQSGVRSA